MSAVRGKSATVLNIVKTVFLAIIAISLVKFTFFPSQAADEVQSLDPSGDYGTITVLPEKGSITNSINLEGTIQTDPATNVKATKTGEVTEIYVKDGDTVKQGDTILLIQKEVQPDPVVPAPSADGQPPAAVEQPKPYYENEWITAPASGKISLSALVSQMVNVGDVIASIQPPTFSAVATLSPDQMYRVQNMPEKATITIKNGPAPFECSGVKIETPHNRNTKEGEGQNSSTTIEARCSIAAEHRVFPGLQVTMGLVAGEAKDVLTIPVSAVEGRFESGVVYTPAPDRGEPIKVPVKLGITDGKRIQVIEGLNESQEILEFVPGKKVDNQIPEGGFLGGEFIPADPMPVESGENAGSTEAN